MLGQTKQKQAPRGRNMTDYDTEAPSVTDQTCAHGLFHTLQDELFQGNHFADREIIRLAAFEYIEVGHNLTKRS